MNKKILILIYSAAHFVELSRVARLIKSAGQDEPVICFLTSYPNIEEHQNECEKEGIYFLEYRELSIELLDAVKTFDFNVLMQKAGYLVPKGLKNFFNFLYQKHPMTMTILKEICLLPFSLLFYLAKILGFPTLLKKIYRSVNMVNQVRVLKSRLSACENFLQQHNPSLIIVAEDNIEYATCCWVKMGHAASIPTIVIPFCIANMDEPAAVFLSKKEHRANRPLNYVLSRINKNWVYEYHETKMVRFPFSRAIAFEILQLTPPNPWMMNSGMSDKILVENEFMQEYYRKSSIAQDKMLVVGSLTDDVLAHGLKNKQRLKRDLLYTHGFSLSKRLIVSALPVDYTTRENDFSSYEELVEFWISSFASLEDFVTIVSLHPSCQYEEMKWLERSNVKIARQDTAQLVPLCDIFAASISSTIRWAISCCIPIVNYDVYRFGFTDFSDCEGVFCVTEKQDFVDCLNHLAFDKEFYEKTCLCMQAQRHYWGMLDGRTGERLLQAIQLYTDNYTMQQQVA